MAAARRIEAIPASSEAVRRGIMSTVASIVRETTIFLERYISNPGEPDTWIGFIDILKSKFSKSTDRLDDFKDLEPLLQRCISDDKLNNTEEIIELRRMVERGKMFDYIVFSLRNDLVDGCENQLKKYCISFAAEAKGEELTSTTSYETKLNEWDSRIQEQLENLDNILDEYDKFRSPIEQYISQYESVLKLMQQTCDTMQQVTEPVKRWISHDAVYARKVQEEINTYNHRKMELRDAVKLLEYQRDQQGLRLKRRAFYTLKLERMLQEARDERRYYKRRAATITENLHRAIAELNRKQNDVKEVRARIYNRKENSPTLYNYLVGMTETLRDDIRKLERKIEMMSKQLAGLEKQIAKAKKVVDQIAIEVESCQAAHKSATEKLLKQEEDVKIVSEEIEKMEKKIMVLKRIREIKLHSDTIKKIYHYGYHPGEIMNNEDGLTHAFKITSESLGKDWSFLYQKLPFMPPRDYRTRTHDIEVLDMSNRRVDGGFRLLTVKSLEKWRRLSTRATVDDLLVTLRQMKKREAVKRIQREVLGTSEKKRPQTSDATTRTVQLKA